MRSRLRFGPSALRLAAAFLCGCQGCVAATTDSAAAADTGAGPDTGATDSDTAPEPDCLATNLPAGVCVVGEGWAESSSALEIAGVVTRVEVSGAGAACAQNTLNVPASRYPAPHLEDAPWIEVDDGTQRWVIGVTIPDALLDVAVGEAVAVKWWISGEGHNQHDMGFSVTDGAGVVVWLSGFSTSAAVLPPGFSIEDADLFCHSDGHGDTGISWSSWSLTFAGPSGAEVTLSPGSLAPLDGYLVGAPVNLREFDIGDPDRQYDRMVVFARLPK